MYRRILVPTDGSPAVERAAEHALDLAKRYDAELHALYVVDETGLPLDAHAELLYERLEAEGRRSVAEIVERAEEYGIDPAVGAVREGSPHRVILDYADENDIDLVVMATHGRRGIDRYLLGSVTDRVVRGSDVPVLTVRTPAPDEE